LPGPLAFSARAAKRIVLVQHIVGRWLRGLLPAPVLGNLLHEAWSADGEPLERMTPKALAKSGATRYFITLPARGQ
jgi:hypothetical protein